MNKMGIQDSAHTPCLYKHEVAPEYSERLLMQTTLKFLQSLGNYLDSILTTTMSWKLPHRTNMGMNL